MSKPHEPWREFQLKMHRGWGGGHLPYVSTIPIKERRQTCPERVFFVCDAKFADTLGVEICEADLPQALIARNEKYSAEIANGQQFHRLAIHFHTTSFAPHQTTIYGQMIFWDL